MAIDPVEVHQRFAYHQPSTDDVARRHQTVRDLHGGLAIQLMSLCPESRELSLAITRLEEAMFWANAAVARHQ